MATKKRKSMKKEEEKIEVAEKVYPPPVPRVTRAAARRATDGTIVPVPEVKAETSTKKKKMKVKVEPKMKTIVIEHCKQCNAFKTRALQVKQGLEDGVSGITVVLNPDKPRRGCFEIREKDGETFISLLEMKRPFQPMKDLDMDKTIKDIVEKIK
ncbi:hypothetical protein CsatB_008239 [Cannabis sativa]|uniref:Selenoprotein H n=2 Tax=Cannabis sativa TaxID=3483 RepID=A0AB40EA67_CANSA|nr:uncharacterized protein LOC115697437 [Cannabis sativa]KAF4351055.1 hypothetical protein G4B88_026093 [Cannabis sativa]KAF4377238.1 hypothetical protein F8388_012339 [Cannabis sativa]